MDASLYDQRMSKSIQIAFKLPQEHLDAIDQLVPDEYPSRAEAVRAAVAGFLKSRRERAIDTALAAGYGAKPPDEHDAAWAEVSLEGLGLAELDW